MTIADENRLPTEKLPPGPMSRGGLQFANYNKLFLDDLDALFQHIDRDISFLPRNH